jgi:hypothetical protein
MKPKVLILIGVIAIVIILWTLINKYTWSNEGFGMDLLANMLGNPANMLASQENSLTNRATETEILGVDVASKMMQDRANMLASQENSLTNRATETEILGVDLFSKMAQDRANMLASQQNPLTNPAAEIGISEESAKVIRDVTDAALNVPTAIPTGTGSFTYTDPVSKVSPRIDTELSLLGMIKFCKERGAQPNPFGDFKFNQNCGMCLTSGSLLTGETFNTPTGVFIPEQDKVKANSLAQTNGYQFPRVIPSLNAAVCRGASTADDAMPVLAIDHKTYNAFQKRLECRHGGIVGNGCGICQANKEFSYIDPKGGFQPLALLLGGEGTATVRFGVHQVGSTISLSSSLQTFQLGRVEEGATIQVEVVKGKTVNGPIVFGRIESQNPNGSVYRLNLQTIIEKDAITGSTPRRSRLGQMVAKPGGDRMVLEGKIPLTFVDPDQLAAYDCKASPFMTKQASAELLIDDPCLKPKGQGPGNYSEECLRQKVLEGGCTSDGTYYKNPQAGNMTLANFLSFIREKARMVETDPAVSMACRGVDISTPCDKFLNNTEIPDNKCLVYLYSNASVNNKRVGNTYKYASQSFTSLNGRNIQFCQRSGTLNPENQQGEAELMGVARGYKGYKGIEAVRRYLSDIFNKAIGSLDANKRDVEGGKKDSLAKCFGIPIADPMLAKVKTNSAGLVTSEEKALVCMSGIPTSFIPRNNLIVRDGFRMPENYVLSCLIRPGMPRGDWSNILRFGQNTGNCCTHGQRALAIWFFPGNTRLHIRISDQRDGNWGIDTDNLPIEQDSKLRIECFGKLVTVTVNARTYTGTQPSQRFTGIVTLFMSDRHHEAANCQVKNFCFTPL